MLSAKELEIYTRVAKSKSHLKILGTRMVKGSKFSTEDPQTLSATVQNLVL
jgi:hypothetical protein